MVGMDWNGCYQVSSISRHVSRVNVCVCVCVVAGIQKNSEIDEDLPWERKRNPKLVRYHILHNYVCQYLRGVKSVHSEGLHCNIQSQITCV